MKRQTLLLALTLSAVSCAEAPGEGPAVVYESGGTSGQAGRSGSSGQGAAGSGAGRSGASGSGGSAAGTAGTSAGGSAGSGGGSGAGGALGGGNAGTGNLGSGGTAGSGGSGATSAGGSAGNLDGGTGSGGTGGTAGGPATGFAVQYQVEIGGAGSAIGSQLWVVNNGTATVNLNELKLRYYFTNEVTGALIQNINWANIGPISGATTSIPSTEITITAAALTPTVAGADTYVEFGFSGGRTLASGSRVQFSWTVQNHASQTFNQTGDYSFNAGFTSQMNWQNVVLFQGQSVLWGVQP